MRVMEEVMGFAEVVNALLSESQSNAQQGKKFEKLIKAILQREMVLQNTFHIKKVYLWSEFSDKYHINRADFGIDIMIETHNDEFISVQCKAFKPEHTLSLGDVKNFLGINSIFNNKGDAVIKISQSLLFCTCKGISNEVLKALETNANADKAKGQAYGYNELQNLSINWEALELNNIENSIQIKGKKSLRPHQLEAFEAIKSHFLEQVEQKDDCIRGKVIMACGTGKSLLAIRSIDYIVQSGEIALFLTPSLALTNQIIKEFFSQSESKHYEVFAVCSDKKVGSKIDNEDAKSNELCIAPTTNAITLANKITQLIPQNTNHRDFMPPPPCI